MKALLEHIINSSDIDSKNLINAISHLSEDIQERFVELVLGIADEHGVCESLPETSKTYRGYVAHLLSYDYLTDTVSYEYEETVDKYFDTRENADKYSENGTVCGASNYKQTDECPYIGTRSVTRTSTMSRADWLYRADE